MIRPCVYVSRIPSPLIICFLLQELKSRVLLCLCCVVLFCVYLCMSVCIYYGRHSLVFSIQVISIELLTTQRGFQWQILGDTQSVWWPIIIPAERCLNWKYLIFLCVIHIARFSTSEEKENCLKLKQHK